MWPFREERPRREDLQCAPRQEKCSNATMARSALVGVVMGSRRDYATMEACVELLREFEIPYEARIVSAHRTPDLLFQYASEAEDRGLKVIIAAAGGAAH